VITVSKTTRVGASPDEAWKFFSEMDTHYLDWHREHLNWRWLAGEPLSVGTVWFADEWIGWLRLGSSRWFIVESEEPRRFAFRIGLPHSLVRAGGSFTFAPTPDGQCDITEEFHFGFGAPLIGPIVDLVLRAALPMSDFRRHIEEEGDGLVRLLGAAASTA
jgi:hypothetical protein